MDYIALFASRNVFVHSSSWCYFSSLFISLSFSEYPLKRLEVLRVVAMFGAVPVATLEITVLHHQDVVVMVEKGTDKSKLFFFNTEKLSRMSLCGYFFTQFES